MDQFTDKLTLSFFIVTFNQGPTKCPKEGRHSFCRTLSDVVSVRHTPSLMLFVNATYLCHRFPIKESKKKQFVRITHLPIIGGARAT